MPIANRRMAAGHPPIGYWLLPIGYPEEAQLLYARTGSKLELALGKAARREPLAQDGARDGVRRIPPQAQ